MLAYTLEQVANILSWNGFAAQRIDDDRVVLSESVSVQVSETGMVIERCGFRSSPIPSLAGMLIQLRENRQDT